MLGRRLLIVLGMLFGHYLASGVLLLIVVMSLGSDSIGMVVLTVFFFHMWQWTN